MEMNNGASTINMLNSIMNSNNGCRQLWLSGSDDSNQHLSLQRKSYKTEPSGAKTREIETVEANSVMVA